MKLHILLLGVGLSLVAQAASKPRQDDPKAERILTGCVDQQAGQYVLLDNRMVKIAALEAAGSDDSVFAKHVGYRVRVAGTQASGPKGAFRAARVERLPGECGQAK